MFLRSATARKAAVAWSGYVLFVTDGLGSWGWLGWVKLGYLDRIDGMDWVYGR